METTTTTVKNEPMPWVSGAITSSESPAPSNAGEVKSQSGASTSLVNKDINRYSMFVLRSIGKNSRTGIYRVRITDSKGARPSVPIPIGKPFNLLKQCNNNRGLAEQVFKHLRGLATQRFKMEWNGEYSEINGQKRPVMVPKRQPEVLDNGDPNPEAGKFIPVGKPSYYLEPWSEVQHTEDFGLKMD